MGCNCNKEEKVSFLSMDKQKNIKRAEELIDNNFGGSKNEIDRKRKMAILKRKQKL